MALSRLQKRVLWCVGTPLGIGLAAWASLTLLERGTEAEIQREETALRGMGLDTRRYDVADDAASGLVSFAAELQRRRDDKLEPPFEMPNLDPEFEPRMRTLEGLLKKRWLSGVLLSEAWDAGERPRALHTVEQWIRGQALLRLRRGDFITLTRLEQSLSKLHSSGCRTPSETSAGEVILMQSQRDAFGDYVQKHEFTKPQARRWLKGQIQAQDTYRQNLLSVEGHLNGVRLRLLRPKMTKFNAFDVKWWRGLIEGNRYIRLKAELAAMRAWKEVLTAHNPDVESLSPLGDLLSKANSNLASNGDGASDLARRTSGSVKIAVTVSFSGLGGGASGLGGGATDPECHKRISLIALDVLGQLWDGGPRKPTWSKPFCFDPASGKPLVVGFKDEILTIKGPSTSWSYRVPQ